MNKKVLFISYFFPPTGGGGVIRATKFVKYLPYFNWQPFIVTPKKSFYPISDKTLLKEIPPKAEIVRVKYFEPAFWSDSRFWRSFLAYLIYPLFLIPDRQILWFLPAVITAYKVIKKERIKVIFTSSAPASDHLIGWVLKKLTGAKWVADFRDEWTKSPYFKFPSPIHKKIAQILEKMVLKNADVVTTVSEGLTDSFGQILKNGKKFSTITNGFDSDDFVTSENVRNKKFTIVHSGTFYGDRKGDLLFQTISDLKLKDIKLEIVGAGKRLSHQDSLKKLLTADILLLVLSPKDGPAVLTGKIFEYLAARKPILAIAPKNSGAAKLVRELKVGEVADPGDANEIKEKLLKLHQKWLASRRSGQKNDLKIPKINLQKYERKDLTKDLAGIFETLIEKSSLIKLCLIGNASSVHNQNLVNYLKNHNYEIHFISTTKAEIPHIKIHYLGKNYFTPWHFVKSVYQIRKIVQKIKPDIVHGQDLVFAGIWAYLSGFHPYVVTTWGSDVWKFESFVAPEKYLIRKTIQEADLVTGSSLALRDQSLKIGMSRKNWQLVHFGIDLETFKNKKLNIKQDKKIIFCPRSIAPIYNTDILIDAMALIDREANAKLFLMETGAEQGYLKKIKKQIEIKNLEEDVKFFGKISQEVMIDLYNLADVIVSLTTSDGCSVSFLEAMACEKKIVATNLPYIQEWEKGKNFWVVPIRDTKATAAALIEASDYPLSKWQKIGRSNRQLVLKNAEVNSNFEKLDRLYRKLI